MPDEHPVMRTAPDCPATSGLPSRVARPKHRPPIRPGRVAPHRRSGAPVEQHRSLLKTRAQEVRLPDVRFPSRCLDRRRADARVSEMSNRICDLSIRSAGAVLGAALTAGLLFVGAGRRSRSQHVGPGRLARERPRRRSEHRRGLQPDAEHLHASLEHDDVRPVPRGGRAAARRRRAHRRRSAPEFKRAQHRGSVRLGDQRTRTRLRSIPLPCMSRARTCGQRSPTRCRRRASPAESRRSATAGSCWSAAKALGLRTP
jgi:hypothetical protein